MKAKLKTSGEVGRPTGAAATAADEISRAKTDTGSPDMLPIYPSQERADHRSKTGVDKT